MIDSAKAKAPGFAERIFGKDGKALLQSGNADEDAKNIKQFNEAAAKDSAIEDGEGVRKCCASARTVGPSRCRS